MALKDWKEAKIDYKGRYEYYNSKRKIAIILTKELNGWKCVVENWDNNGLPYDIKHFKYSNSKKAEYEALKFAKQYMRTH